MHDLAAVRARDEEVEGLDVPVDHHPQPATLQSLSRHRGGVEGVERVQEHTRVGGCEESAEGT